ncbi:hypothetical protein BpHYR1_031384 [Brachionus plicatilis]|uniref:Uncharacterized protein n=1 Tax=Brachionus plicatilis TaxID=10195 RepID=A0A3M7STU0_BRAPC|nr:hypothetical protein BpHYR1_031384 [Brachionus plicatilis]
MVQERRVWTLQIIVHDDSTTENENEILGATSNLDQLIDFQHAELSDWLDAYRRWTKRGKKIEKF